MLVAKDYSAALLAREFGAGTLLIPTDVPAVYTDWVDDARGFAPVWHAV